MRVWLTIAVVLGLAGPAVAQGEALSQGGVLRRVDGTRFELLDRHGGAGFGFRGLGRADDLAEALAPSYEVRPELGNLLVRYTGSRRELGSFRDEVYGADMTLQASHILLYAGLVGVAVWGGVAGASDDHLANNTLDAALTVAGSSLLFGLIMRFLVAPAMAGNAYDHLDRAVQGFNDGQMQRP